MSAVFFWILAITTVSAACAVILHRNPIACALALAASMVSLAALFVTLEAFFIAAVQVIVYAGAVVVLFLFIIMLLNVGEEQKKAAWGFRFFGTALGCALMIFFARMVRDLPHGSSPLKWGSVGWGEGIQKLGKLLFQGYMLPFLTTALLLLLATVGAIILSKKDAQ